MSSKKTTVSLAKTPVRRALAKAKGSYLIFLFIIGIVAGIIYNTYFAEKTVDIPVFDTVQQQR